MKKITLSDNSILVLLTVMAIFFCLSFSSCSKVAQPPTINCWLNDEITDTNAEHLIFHLEAEFTPNTYGEPLSSFDYYITVEASANGLPTIYKDIHLTDESFSVCYPKMVFLKRFDFAEYIDIQTQNRYTVKISKINLQMSN
jgi:hypothetical protein